MEFKDYLEQTSKKLNREIEKILALWLKEVGKIDQKLLPLAKMFIKANFGGKRIRGTLVRLGYEIACPPSGGPKTPRNDVIKIGAAYEILHTAILAHDDIMDESTARRGRKSLYRSVGVSHAITLGDLGFFLAIKIISESKFEDKTKNKALKIFSNVMIDTAIGQMLDIENADPVIIARLKTAQYTIIGPLQLGAILVGANEKLLANLGDFGHHLGITFQIRDDILDGEALDNVGQMGVKYVTDAKTVIPKLTKDKYNKKLLTGMAEFLVNRQS